MSNLAKLENARPQEYLARLQSRNPHFLDELSFRVKVTADLRFSPFSAPERIREAIEQNRRALEDLPTEAELEPLIDAVRKALASCSEKTIRQQVAQLIGAFPNANPTDPETYIAALVFDLLDSQIPDAILILACQEIRRTARFLPTIAEVIEAANRHRGRWEDVLALPETLARTRQQLSTALESGERTLKRVEADGVFVRDTLPPSLPKLQRKPAIHYPSLQHEFEGDQAMLQAIGALDANRQCEASVALARRGREAAEAVIRKHREVLT